MDNDRRFFALDAPLGRHLEPERPFVAEVLAAGEEDLRESGFVGEGGRQPTHVVVGLEDGPVGVAELSRPVAFDEPRARGAREPRDEMLRALSHECPAQVGEHDEFGATGGITNPQLDTVRV